jgi:hypothetical protein
LTADDLEKVKKTYESELNKNIKFKDLKNRDELAKLLKQFGTNNNRRFGLEE